MSEKIHTEHIERTAYVYVRQSSNQQVRDHREGRERQYALADLARRLKFRKVVVIDDDLGRSGSGLQERPGFARLLTAVCQGDAGAVLALEASRLARNNRDWHHLIDLCGLTATLTEAEVVSILGAGTPSSRPDVPADLKELTWKDGQNEIDVQFKDGKAVGIHRQTTD